MCLLCAKFTMAAHGAKRLSQRFKFALYQHVSTITVVFLLSSKYLVLLNGKVAPTRFVYITSIYYYQW